MSTLSNGTSDEDSTSPDGLNDEETNFDTSTSISHNSKMNQSLRRTHSDSSNRLEGTSDEGSPSPDRICYTETNLEMSAPRTHEGITNTSLKRTYSESSNTYEGTSHEVQTKKKLPNSKEFHSISQSSQSESASHSSSSSDSDSDSSPMYQHQWTEEERKMPSVFDQGLSYHEQQKMAYVDTRGLSMLEKMGYKKGTGLGKNAQGRVAPVEASKQHGRRGLGLQIPGLEDDDVEWNPELEKIEILEPLQWLKSTDYNGLEYEDIKHWMVEGPRKETIDDETNFIDRDILQNILNSKSIFDDLSPDELRRARTLSNVFETIRGVFFLNRAAVKMANMDARTDFMFTNPKRSNGEPAVEKDSLLYFADVCAGPGGFSEYVLWRKKWFAKGFGFTLKDSNDFKLYDFLAGSPESFQTYYGEDDDGDIYKPRNIDALKNYVLDQTPGNLGVHFMMADGGFSVDGQENIQEILSKQLYLCQCLVALSIVRPDGHFVVKLFDLFTPFSMGLMYLMYRSFKQICIMKPNTSRPANSERYLICKWRIEDVSGIEKYLYYANFTICEYPTGYDKDINELVPMDVMREDTEFMNYFVESNNSLGEKQIIGLHKIRAFCQNRDLVEVRQNDVRTKCLQAWNIEDKIRTRVRDLNTNTVIEKLNQSIGRTSDHKIGRLLLSHGQSIETLADYKKFIGDVPYERIFMATAKGKPGEQSTLTFYLGLGGNRIYRFENCKWVSLRNIYDFALPSGTLIYGEVALEFQGQNRAQTNLPALHIVDAMFLGEVPIYKKTLLERMKLCELFTSAISQPNRSAIRMKRYMPLEKFEKVAELDVRAMKNGQYAMAVDIPGSADGKDPLFYVPDGFIFLNELDDLWRVHISRTQRKQYYYNSKTKESIFEKRPNILGNFFSCFYSRCIWRFESSMQNLHPQSSTEELHSRQIIEYMKPNIL